MKKTDCTTAEKWIVKALDEGLAPDERLRLDEHLAECLVCRGMSEATKYALDSVAQDVPADPGEEFWRLYDQSLAARLQEKELRTRWWLGWKVAAAAVISGIVILSATLGIFEAWGPKEDTSRGSQIAAEVMNELVDVYGPIQEERTSLGLSAEGVLLPAALHASSNGTIVGWFEVEDESDQLFM